MDFCNDNELDYEEDEIEEMSPNETNGEIDETNENSNVTGSDDQYLQIDFSEEEEKFLSRETHVETDTVKTEKVGKVSEQNEREYHQSTSAGKEESQETSTINDSNKHDYKNASVKNLKKKEYFNHFNHRSQFKNKMANKCEFEENLNVSTGIQQNGIPEEFLITESGKRLKRSAIYSRNRSINLFEFGKLELELKNQKGPFNRPYNGLQDDEKKMLKIKKEARLKRFMCDDIAQKEKADELNSQNTTQNDLHLELQHSPKIDRQKLLRENFSNVKRQKTEKSGCGQRIFVNEKPDINKEMLLKKRNPFDVKIETSGDDTMIKIKLENENTQREECVQNKSFNCVEVESNEMEEANSSTSDLISQGFFWRKNMRKSSVKFVRTVTKDYNDLAVDNGYPSSALHSGKTLPFVRPNSGRTVFSRKDFQQPQLTGCIVKVSNIPFSTTADDILALCNPIGTIMEIKLNFPKENSAVIRFAEPSCAEKFFRTFNGKKMNNGFLNVVVV